MPTQSRLHLLRYRIKQLVVRDFSGGPNIREAPPELADNEAVDSWNVSYDERGGVGARLGYVKYNSSAYGGGLVQNEFYSGIVQDTITQAGASLYKGTSTVANKTFTTSARVTFADFAGKLCVTHPVDGIFTSTDGVTFNVVADVDAPKGDAIAVWQNKLYIAGQGTTNPARVSWSAAGDPTAWSATDFNDLREKDNEKVVALAGAAGIDIQGRPGLLAFKRTSTYRIFSSTTGEYSTVDTSVGAAGPLAVQSVGQNTIALSQRGLYMTDGIGPMREQTSRFLPLWDPGQINFSKLELFCAGRRFNRVHFSLPRAGSTVNDFTFEFHPEQGWCAPGSHAMACYASYGLNNEVLLGGSPSVTGQAYQLYSGGTDDGTAISTRFQTRWYEVSGGFLAQLWQVRLQLRGTFTMALRKDFLSNDSITNTVTQSPAGPFWDSFHYDNGAVYANPGTQSTVGLFGFGVVRQFSVRIYATSSTTTAGAQLFGQGAGPTLGAWSLYGISALYIPLGWA